MVVGKEGSVRLLQVDSFTELVSISVGGKVKAVAVSRGGKMLATLLSLPGESEYYEGSARAQIWDVETGQEIARLDNVEGGSLAFSGDSRALLIALTRYDYGELWLWRPEATIAEVYKTAGRRLTEMEWADLGVSWEHQIFSP